VQKKKFRSYNEVRSFVQTLGLKNNSEWRKYCKSGKKPKDIPTTPDRTYQKEWTSWGDFLGTGNVYKKQYRPFEDARKFTHSLGIKSQREWTAYCKSSKKPKDIPTNAQRFYKNKGWKNYGDWLGTWTIRPRDRVYWSYDKAREFVQKLGLKNTPDWRQFTKSGKLPKEIPANPNQVYKNKGWKSFGDWLGTGSIASYYRKYKPFEDARKFVHSLRLKSQYEWVEYTKSGNKPEEIPASPALVYKNKGWKGNGDWLGTYVVATNFREYWPYEKAREYVHKLGINGQKEWRTFTKTSKLPKEIPADPHKVYQNKGWISYGDWLGTGTIAPKLREYWKFEKARDYVQKLELKNTKDWYQLIKSGKLPNQIPRAPEHQYKLQGWISWGDWLGTENISPSEISKNYLSFKEAREENRRLVKLYGIKTLEDWKKAKRLGKIPENIPAAPWRAYSKNRVNNGNGKQI